METVLGSTTGKVHREKDRMRAACSGRRYWHRYLRENVDADRLCARCFRAEATDEA